MLSKNEIVHVVTRRLFPGDQRRHFVGKVEDCDTSAFRATGFVFVFDGMRNEFRRIDELRTRILGLADSRVVINVLPSDTDIDAVHYALMGSRLVVTDGGTLCMDIDEFRAHN